MRTEPNHPAHPVSEEETDRIDADVKIYSGVIVCRQTYRRPKRKGGTTMRTRAEWFKLLSEDQRRRAVFNTYVYCPHDFTESMRLQDSSMSDAIMGGFLMEDTPEGESYWLQIALDPKWKQYEEEK